MLDTSPCSLCPNACFIDRNTFAGKCLTSSTLRVARAALHFFEEPCVSGTRGSGTVFFCGCNMSCVYCQNHQISNNRIGTDISVARLARIFEELEKKEAHNINLVSPSHYAPQIALALDIYRPGIPIIYNTNGYEKADTIAHMSSYIDVYLTDLKYINAETAHTLSKRRDYPKYALDAIAEMIRQKGKPVFDNHGILTRGVLIRHLVIPSYVDESLAVLGAIAKNFKDYVLISLMSQYTPLSVLNLPKRINRRLKPLEYKIVLKKAGELGLDNGYIQEYDSAKASYIPDFNLDGVF